MNMKNPTLNVIKGDLDAVEALMVSVYNSLGEWLRNCEKLKKRHKEDCAVPKKLDTMKIK